MNKIFLTIILLFCFLTTSAIAQQNENPEYYRVHSIKFKNGQADAGTEIGMRLFNAAIEQTGVETIVLKAETGPWDLLVLIPVDPGEPFSDHRGEDFYNRMIKIAGSDAKLESEMDRYNETVYMEQQDYYRKLTPEKLDVSDYYRARYNRYAHGKHSEAIEIGMRLFNGALKKAGKNNMVLRGIAGPWNILVIEPVSASSPFVDDHSDKWFEYVLEIAGSEEALFKDFDAYNAATIREDLQYFKRVE